MAEDVTDLEKKVVSIYAKQGEIRDNLKPIERRLNTLKEHLYQYEFYVKYKKSYDRYEKLPQKTTRVLQS